MNIVDFEKYKLKSQKKDQTWLYSLNYDQLFGEFIMTFEKFEKDPHCQATHEWLDQVSDALNERFYNSKTKQP